VFVIFFVRNGTAASSSTDCAVYLTNVNTPWNIYCLQHVILRNCNRTLRDMIRPPLSHPMNDYNRTQCRSSHLIVNDTVMSLSPRWNWVQIL
jgi:hypothetical protein